MSDTSTCETPLRHRKIAEPEAAEPTAFPIEFLGWLPAFLQFGNCGTHPQFGHTQTPPPGYRFTRSCPDLLTDATNPSGWIVRKCKALRAFGLLKCLATLFLFLRSFVRSVLKTGRVGPSFRFVRSRHFKSQVVSPRRAELVFLTSVPFTLGQNPWVIEIEDPTTLFYPFVQNGHTQHLDIARSPYFELVKDLLEADACRGIVSHMRSTAEALPRLFRSKTIARKVTYAPLGVVLPKRWQTQEDDETINLLFTNSWHQLPVGFHLRGGLDVLEAFWILHARYPQLRLTIRSSLPQLDERYHRIVENGWVRLIGRFTPAATMDAIQRETHIFLLPAARIHIVSVLQAMSYGQAVVVSDGWGMDEYITNEVNGLIVEGRAGKVSWMDREAGFLRENYRPMDESDPLVVEGIVEAVSRLVEERSLRRRLGAAARNDIETKYSIENWNLALKKVFDNAR